MASSSTIIERAKTHLEDARDPNMDVSTRVEAFDAVRGALLDARRARAQPEELVPIFDGLCTAAISDPSHVIRAVVPQAVEDFCLRDLKSFTPSGTDFLSRTLADDHVLVVRRAVRTLTVLFRRLIGFIASYGVSEDAFPESRLMSWLGMEEKAISYVEALDDGLRKAAIKFAETVVLAFSFSGSTGSADHFTLDYMLKRGSKSPLLDIAALESEGVRCVKQVAKLLHAGLEGVVKSVKADSSSSRGLPPSSFMTAIAVLSNLVRRRKKILQFTLAPLLNIVSAITASKGPPSRAFHDLSESQKQSINTVMRFSLRSILAYQHARSGRAGVDISAAANDLSNYEKEQEAKRKRIAKALAAEGLTANKSSVEQPTKASSQAVRNVHAAVSQPLSPQQQHPGKPEMEAVAKTQVVSQRLKDQDPPPMQMKRPRAPQKNHNQHWPRLSPQDAKTATRALVQRMPHKEVVNFIMTRILLDIPPTDTIVRNNQYSKQDVTQISPTDNEPLSKRPRKSRFGSNDVEKQSLPQQKKAAPKRKVAPPIIVPRFSEDAMDQLAALCCRRILTRDEQATSSGAGPLRLQLLSRLLADFAMRDSAITNGLCEEVCKYVTDHIDKHFPLAQAWLHRLFVVEELSSIQETIQTSSDDDLRLSEYNSAVQKLGYRSSSTSGTPGSNIVLTIKSNAEREDTDHATNLSVKSETSVVQEIKVETASDESLIAKDKEARSEKQDLQPRGTSTNTTSVVPDPKEENKLEKHGDVQDQSIILEKKKEEEEDEELEECEDLDLQRVYVVYERILKMLLLALKERSDDSEDAFHSMVTQAPVLPDSIISFLKELCTDPSRMKLGLHALCHIISERSGSDRHSCLNLLLDIAFHSDEVFRESASRILANNIFSTASGEVPRLIEERAIRALEDAVSPNASEDSNIERDSLLITALCGRKADLFNVLVSAFVVSSAPSQEVLLSRGKELAEHLGMTSLPMLELISGTLSPSPQFSLSSERFTTGSAALGVGVLKVWMKKFRKPSEEVVNAALTRYEISANVEFILPVLPGLKRESLLQHLSAVVNAVTQSENTSDGESGEKKGGKNVDGFKNIITLLMTSRNAVISPAELLVELHKLDANGGVSTAIRACFESKAVFKQPVIAQAIQQLIEMPIIPDLLMRSVHFARIFHPDLEKYITGTVMKRLIEKSIWTNSLVWEGFLKYCADIKEKSVKLLLSLPVAQLEDALGSHMSLTAILKDLVSNPKNLKKISNTRKREVIRGAISKYGKSKKYGKAP